MKLLGLQVCEEACTITDLMTLDGQAKDFDEMEWTKKEILQVPSLGLGCYQIHGPWIPVQGPVAPRCRPAHSLTAGLTCMLVRKGPQGEPGLVGGASANTAPSSLLPAPHGALLAGQPTQTRSFAAKEMPQAGWQHALGVCMSLAKAC